MRRAALISSPELWAHGHGESHPLRPERLRMTYELLEGYGAFDGPSSCIHAPSLATEAELALWHTPEYILAVQALSRGEVDFSPRRYNFGPGDNPVFAGMYESEALKVGASLLAARMVLERQVDVAFSFAGGLHHAMAGHASGFCVFNDAAIAIRWLADRGQRVLYVDIDAHHGDGVQAAFDETAQVMTISLHESGEVLFPGTGFPSETGKGPGEGYSANVPLLPYTSDEIYWWAFERTFLPLAADMQPDILVTQLGVDAHYQDPLAHLNLTTQGYTSLIRAFRAMELPWVALGGGGYNVHTVARAWTLAYGIMADRSLPDEIPHRYARAYGDKWLHDRGQPSLSRQDAASAQRYAERQVAALQRSLGHEHFEHNP